MHQKTKLNLYPVSEMKSLKTLVENRTAFTLNHCELNIFETHQPSEKVPLTFGDFVVTSMLRGKKVMHLSEKPGFNYLPGETVLVPANQTMRIDFPEASSDNPTQCIALALDGKQIEKVIGNLNEKYAVNSSEGNFRFRHVDFHLSNHEALAQNLNKLIQICSTNHLGKDLLAELALQELIIHIIQIQNLKETSENQPKAHNQSPLAYVMHYIREHVTDKFHIDQLSQKACMSRATFYRAFKREYGLNPLEYILTERIKKAKDLLINPYLSVTEVCYESGFSDLNYFDRQFKKHEGITPKQFRAICLSSVATSPQNFSKASLLSM
jgi:AraC-like DNA-binding protein